MTKGAVTPSLRSAATRVNVFQWPCGTFATRRSPRGLRPYRRTILVVTAVSSMKTRRDGASDGCSAFNWARAAATSGRSCSAACSVFFNGDLVASEEAPDRSHSNLQLLLARKARADLLERQVGFRGDKIEHPSLVPLERRAALARAQFALCTSRCRPAVDPTDRRRRAKIQEAQQQPLLPRTAVLRPAYSAPCASDPDGRGNLASCANQRRSSRGNIHTSAARCAGARSSNLRSSLLPTSNS